MPSGLAITKKTARAVPRVPFFALTKRILGTSYTLSVVFTTDKSMKQLNRIYRNIDKTTDILSFALDKKVGELFISISEAARRSRSSDMTERNYLGFIFIHGLLHLKGYRHGVIMDRLEKKYCEQFGLKLTEHST